MVSILASAAQLAALLGSLSSAERNAWLNEVAGGDGLNRDLILSGQISESAGRATEAMAGPFDVSWDGNWPREKAHVRLRGRIPSSKRAGDIVIGSDFGGTRIDILVIQEPDGVLTGDPLPTRGETRLLKTSGSTRTAGSPCCTPRRCHPSDLYRPNPCPRPRRDCGHACLVLPRLPTTV